MVCFEFSFSVCYDCQTIFHLLLAEQGTKNLQVSIGFYLAFGCYFALFSGFMHLFLVNRCSCNKRRLQFSASQV